MTGVLLSQFLVFIDEFYDDPNRQTKGAPGAGANSAGEGNPKIGNDFKRDVWKSFTAHPDVLVGEDKRGNHLDLSEIEALPLPAVESLDHSEGSPSRMVDLAQSRYDGRAFSERYPEHPSSPSAQLLEQMQPEALQTMLPVLGESTTSTHDDARNAPVDDQQQILQSSEPFSHKSHGVTKESRRKSSNHTNHVPENDTMVHRTMVHTPYTSEASEPSGQELGDQEGVSVKFQALKMQPRIYVSQKHIRNTPTPGNGISHSTVPDLKPPTSPPKHRGQPPKVNATDPPRRRGRPPKAKVATPALSTSPSLPMPQYTPNSESPRGENTVSLEFTPEPEKRRGRQTHKVAIFTSHDEFQRAAGIPGVYFDVIEREKTGVGRPKKTKIALFKSEKLKSLLWMKENRGDVGTGNTMDQPLIAVEIAVIADPTKKSAQENSIITQKRSRDPEVEAASDEPRPKKLLLDNVRRFGSSRPNPYQSPYSSSPATSYVSPYSADASVVTPSTARNGSPPNLSIVVSGQVSTRFLSATAKPLAFISEYSSPYAPMQLASAKPLDKSSTSNSSVEQPLVIEGLQSKKDKQLDAAIISAGELAIPNITTRLPSSKDGVAGNLCLSTDKKSVTFLTGETETEPKTMIFQVSDIVESPEISIVGSETRILRITTSGINGEEEIHSFRFLPTEAAIRAANNMRAKIVTAMTLLDLEDNTEIARSDKPFRCSECDGAWKNREGLKYHQTKSKTPCNPNYKRREESAPIAGQDILGLAAAALDILNGDVVVRSEKSSFPERSRDDTDGEQQPAKGPTLIAAGIKSRDARSDPELQRGKDIIMALLNANERVFPGEKSLWFAFVASSLQKYPDSGLPGYSICSIAVDLLADSGQIRKVQFSFKDKTGLMKMRTFITSHDVDPTSAVVMAMKENIKTVFPEYYIPPGFAPPKVVQSMLEERQNCPEVADSAFKAHKSTPISHVHKSVTEQVSDAPYTPFNDAQSNKVTRSGRISRRPQRLEQSTLESSSQNLEEIMNKEDDESFADDLSNHDSTSRSLNFATDGRPRRRRSKVCKANLQDSHPTHGISLLDEGNLVPPPQMMEDEAQQETDLDRPQRKRGKNERRLAESAPDRKAMWQPASSYLQGKNGSWNTPTPSRSIRKYAPRTGLPEPITYLQTLKDSAWNFRPYGHGVRPIHARPTKRAEVQTAYLTRIQHGFRPVIMPNGDIFIPSTPSNKILDRTLDTAVKGVPQTAGSNEQKRKYIRRPSNIPNSQEIVTEGLPQLAGSITKKRKYTNQILNTSKTQAEIPLPTAKRQRVAEPNSASMSPIPQTLYSEDEHSARNFSTSSESDPLHGSGQDAPRASNEPGIEPTLFDDILREEKAWDLNHRAPAAQYMMTARRLTALPADLEGIEESLADHPDLKVEVAVDHQHNIRRRTRDGAISTNTEFRLMVAVVVIRTLTGGLDKQIDWVLVSKLFPDFPMNAVSKRWPNLYTKHRQMVERLGTDFQEFFLEAYERGEVSPIDYDHLVDYDWNSLLDLVIERIDINPNKSTTHRLPASRSSLNQMFTMNNAENSKAWRDDYFGLLPAVYKRMEYAASEQYTMPISEEPPPNLDIDELTVAKSWARANTLTPAGSYDKDFAARKLASIGNGAVAAATSSLFESKVLMQRNKGRPTPNRGVEITDTFASALRKHLDETHLTQAVAFKTFLDAKFRAGEIPVVEWAAKDGEILAITNLQAHGRIKLEPKGVPMNRFGLTGGGYQTKRMDKANLRFDLQILPTPSYIYDADLPIFSSLSPEFSPPRGIAGAIPVWYDIGENLIPNMWKKVLCVVLATIAMRPGALPKELVRIFAPALEEWEMRVLIEWGLRVGALTVLREGCDGWNVAEWWWVIGGRA